MTYTASFVNFVSFHLNLLLLLLRVLNYFLLFLFINGCEILKHPFPRLNGALMLASDKTMYYFSEQLSC